MFAHYDKFLQLCLTSGLVYLLAGIGFLLLIVPGVIVVLGLGFAPYLVVDRNLGVAEALRGLGHGGGQGARSTRARGQPVRRCRAGGGTVGSGLGVDRRHVGRRYSWGDR